MVISMKDKIIELTRKEIKLLKKHFPILKFNSDFFLVYEAQIPNTGIVLLNGELTFFKNNKIKFSVMPGTMFGLSMLFNNKPSAFGCRVKENSEIILIQKSDILEAISNEDSELHPMIKEKIG